MDKSSSQACFVTRYISYLASKKRLQLAVLALVVWTSGLYMGANNRITFHIRGAYINLRYTNNTEGAVRQANVTRRASVLTNVSVKKKQHSVFKMSKISLQATQHQTSPSFISTIGPNPVTESTSKPTISTIRMAKSTSNLARNRSESRGCRFAEMNSTNPILEKYLKKQPPLDCSSNTPNVVYLNDDELKIDSSKVKEALKKAKSNGTLGFCQYQTLQRKSNTDNSVNVNFTSAQFKVSIKLTKSDKDIKVECKDTKNQTISRSYFAVIRSDPEKERVYNNSYKVHIHKNSPAETLSILVLGVDGFSKQHFARAMPKTRKFLIQQLGALEMHKHSKLGYSTSPNVLGLLTGRTNKEFIEDPNWSYKIHGAMDQINEAFAWSDARRLGYRTGLMMDEVIITAFHYMKAGFKSNPVDFYLRPIVVDSNEDVLMRGHNKNCYGDEPEITKLYDYWLQLFRIYNSTKTNRTPVFAYSFLSRLTHNDRNRAYSGDDLYLKFFTDLKATNALNNTVIIWFSDHGQRYGGVMSTLTGEIETNTPFLFFAFPPWFEKKYPDIMRVFRTNQKRLTSHFDTYATIQDLLYFTGKLGPPGKPGERSISLFREIPIYRSCADAEIPPEYCVCSSPMETFTPSGLPKYLGIVLKNKVSSMIKKHTDKCAKLSFSGLKDVVEEKNPDKQPKPGVRSFRVHISTEPGDAHFQATMTFDGSTNKAAVVGQIERTNNATGQNDCINDAELKPFCYCKSLLATPQKKTK